MRATGCAVAGRRRQMRSASRRASRAQKRARAPGAASRHTAGLRGRGGREGKGGRPIAPFLRTPPCHARRRREEACACAPEARHRRFRYTSAVQARRLPPGVAPPRRRDRQAGGATARLRRFCASAAARAAQAGTPAAAAFVDGRERLLSAPSSNASCCRRHAGDVGAVCRDSGV